MNAKELETKEIYHLWRNFREGKFLTDMTPRSQIFPNMTLMLYISSSFKLKLFSLIIYLNSWRRKKENALSRGTLDCLM